MSVYTGLDCETNLSWEDLITLLVRDDGSGNLYVNIVDSGVAIGDLNDLECQHNLSPEDILRLLIDTDVSGNPAIRAVKLT